MAFKMFLFKNNLYLFQLLCFGLCHFILYSCFPPIPVNLWFSAQRLSKGMKKNIESIWEVVGL